MNIGFIGGGNMAGAIINGLLEQKVYFASDICVSDPNPQVAEKYKDSGITVIQNNCKLVSGCDIIVLAVKPNSYAAVLEEIKQEALQDKLFLSIAIGKSVAQIKEFLGTNTKVIRTMPNTPAFVGEGMTVLAKPEENITEQEFQMAKTIFSAIGKIEVLPESLLNSVGSVSGSSPAYVFVLIEAMADAAVRDGIPRQTAYTLAAQSVLGSAKMVLESGQHPGALKDMVCSPGGTTIAAIESLECDGFRGAIIKAMGECTKKAARM